MDDHKLVMISIFGFLKCEKDANFFENMLGKFFRTWPYAIKYFFLFFLLFPFFFEIFQRKPGILIPDLYLTM
jgi:hypothetical protein